MQTTFTPSSIPTKGSEPSKINEKWLGKILSFFPSTEKIKKYFFGVKTKNISSHVLKILAISLVLRTREITDIFNTFDEIYLVFISKK